MWLSHQCDYILVMHQKGEHASYYITSGTIMIVLGLIVVFKEYGIHTCDKYHMYSLMRITP